MERAWFERLGTFVRRGVRHDWALIKNLMESFTSIEEAILSRLVTPFIASTNSPQNRYDFEPAACSSQVERELLDALRPQLDSLPFPDDVTLLVLRKLAAWQDGAALARASCTCKGLNRLISGDQGDILWRVAFRKETEQPSPDGLDEAVDAFGGYRALIAAQATRSSRKVEALVNFSASGGLNTEFLLLGCLEGKPVAWKAEASGPPDVNRNVLTRVGLRDLKSDEFTARLVICLSPTDSGFPLVQIDLIIQCRWHEHAFLQRDETQQRRGLDRVQGFALQHQNDPSEVILLFDTREQSPPGHVYRIWAP